MLWYPDHRDRLLGLLREADQVVIATAILGGGPVLDALIGIAGSVPVLVATGCGGGLTRRESIESLRDAGAEVLVIDDRTGGLFHPKVYAMKTGLGCVALVGSANLSAGGFGENREAMVETAIGATDLSGLEARLRAEGPLLENLDDLPTPPRSTGHFKPTRKDRVALSDVLGMSWDDYVVAVTEMDGWWKARDLDVFGHSVGWLPTVDALQAHTRKPLAALPVRSRRILVGKRAGEDVAYFGDFNPTPARDVILNPDKPGNTPAVKAIDTARASVGKVGDPLDIDTAIEQFHRLTAISGVWLGVAGRLLLSVRPDVFVSVNEGSRALLVSETGLTLPRQAGRRDRTCPGYRDLLARIQEAPWYTATRPSDPTGDAIWRARAALIDIFVYEPGESRWA